MRKSMLPELLIGQSNCRVLANEPAPLGEVRIGHVGRHGVVDVVHQHPQFNIELLFVRGRLVEVRLGLSQASWLARERTDHMVE